LPDLWNISFFFRGLENSLFLRAKTIFLSSFVIKGKIDLLPVFLLSEKQVKAQIITAVKIHSQIWKEETFVLPEYPYKVVMQNTRKPASLKGFGVQNIVKKSAEFCHFHVFGRFSDF